MKIVRALQSTTLVFFFHFVFFVFVGTVSWTVVGYISVFTRHVKYFDWFLGSQTITYWLLFILCQTYLFNDDIYSTNDICDFRTCCFFSWMLFAARIRYSCKHFPYWPPSKPGNYYCQFDKMSQNRRHQQKKCRKMKKNARNEEVFVGIREKKIVRKNGPKCKMISFVKNFISWTAIRKGKKTRTKHSLNNDNVMLGLGENFT